MLKRTVLSVCCGLAMLAGVAVAQDSATLTLRSGEKITGQLVDLGGVGYTVRVNGSERQIAQNDVAVVDFTGDTVSDADWSKFSGTSVVELRNGQTVNGSIYDISGTSPLKLTIRTSDGDREMSSSDVARVIMARPANVNAVATSGTNPAVTSVQAAPGAVTVQANQNWTSTGVTVRKGQMITVVATGTVQLSDDTNDIATPNGAKSGRYAANAPLKNVLAGGLIGRIGPSGTPFGIGENATFAAPASGLLYLGVNDDGYGDNKGSYQVQVTVK